MNGNITGLSSHIPNLYVLRFPPIPPDNFVEKKIESVFSWNSEIKTNEIFMLMTLFCVPSLRLTETLALRAKFQELSFKTHWIIYQIGSLLHFCWTLIRILQKIELKFKEKFYNFVGELS